MRHLIWSDFIHCLKSPTSESAGGVRWFSCQKKSFLDWQLLLKDFVWYVVLDCFFWQRFLEENNIVFMNDAWEWSQLIFQLITGKLVISRLANNFESLNRGDSSHCLDLLCKLRLKGGVLIMVYGRFCCWYFQGDAKFVNDSSHFWTSCDPFKQGWRVICYFDNASICLDLIVHLFMSLVLSNCWESTRWFLNNKVTLFIFLINRRYSFLELDHVFDMDGNPPSIVCVVRGKHPLVWVVPNTEHIVQHWNCGNWLAQVLAHVLKSNATSSRPSDSV